MTPWIILVVGLLVLAMFRFWPGSSIILNANQERLTPQSIRLMMAVVTSCVVMGASLYIILSQQYDESSQKWAYGAVGTVVGFWFKDN